MPNCPQCHNPAVAKHYSKFGWLYICGNKKCGQGSFWGDDRDKKMVIEKPKRRKR